MTLHDAMGRAFERWREHFAAAGAKLPPAAWDPDIEPFIWDGVPSASQWCHWIPTPKTRRSEIALAAPELPPLHPSIDEYFNAWWFCALEGGLGGDTIMLNPVAPGIELDSFLYKVRAYRQAHGGRLEQVPIGLESRSSLLVVVDNRSGAVAVEDYEDGSLRPIASSLAELIERLEF